MKARTHPRPADQSQLQPEFLELLIDCTVAAILKEFNDERENSRSGLNRNVACPAPRIAAQPRVLKTRLQFTPEGP